MFGFKLGKLGAAIKAGTGSAGVVPLFSRDFTATGSLGDNATFARASNATYVDSNGVIQTASSNEARFDYSSGTRALLMEPAATNSHPYSEDFSDTTYWSNAAFNLPVITLSQTDPAGGATAALINDDSAANAELIGMSGVGITLFAGSQYVFSLFLKKHTTETNKVGVFITEFNQNIICRVKFDLVAGTAINYGTDGSDSYAIESFNDDWWRIKIVFSTGLFTSFLTRVFPAISDNMTAGSIDASVTGSVTVAFAQLELGTIPTSYIPTAGAAATRAADSLSYSGIAVDNETRAVVDSANVDVDDWDGVVDATLLGADNSGLVESITVYTTGERPA